MSDFNKIENQYFTPLEDNRPVKALCEFCGGEIREGDKAYMSPFNIICKDCVDSMTALEFIEEVLKEKLEEA